MEMRNGIWLSFLFCLVQLLVIRVCLGNKISNPLIVAFKYNSRKVPHSPNQVLQSHSLLKVGGTKSRGGDPVVVVDCLCLCKCRKD